MGIIDESKANNYTELKNLKNDFEDEFGLQ